MSRLHLNILLCGFAPDTEAWVRELLHNQKQPWQLNSCDGLRIGAPEHRARERDLILLHWYPRQVTTWEAALNPRGPEGRSPEGVIAEIEDLGGQRLLRRTAVIGEKLSRSDLVFIADNGLKLVFPVPAKQSQWSDEFPEFLKKVHKFLLDEIKGGSSTEEQMTRHFQDHLRVWEKLSDEQKMSMCDKLLGALGDSSQYCELMARKSLKETDQKGAEAWLVRAISKNPSYIKALQLMADLYCRQGRYDDALTLLERLRSADPKNMRRLTQIGQIQVLKGEYLKAEKTLENAICIDEFFRPAREELAKVKFILGHTDDAKTLLSLLPQSKQYAAFLNQIGIRLVENKQFEEAIGHYSRAQYVLPGNEQSHFLLFNIALAFAKWGHISQAKHFARLALAKDPGYQKALMLLERVGEKVSYGATG